MFGMSLPAFRSLESNAVEDGNPAPNHVAILPERTAMAVKTSSEFIILLDSSEEDWLHMKVLYCGPEGNL